MCVTVFSLWFVVCVLQGVLCPTGCELKTTLLKQERDVKPSVAQLKRDVESLSQTSNTVYRYVEDLSSELTERQRINDGKVINVRRVSAQMWR